MMKTTDYRLQSEIENIKGDKLGWFQGYMREVLESDKPYYVKADYIGLSIQEIQNKIDYLASDIREMTALKKSLLDAKDIALEATATVLEEYGIDRMDGVSISSITITPKKTKLKETLRIINADALIELGYCKVVLDEKAIKDAMLTIESMHEIEEFIELDVNKEVIPAKVKVNQKRVSKNQTTELLQQVA